MFFPSPAVAATFSQCVTTYKTITTTTTTTIPNVDPGLY